MPYTAGQLLNDYYACTCNAKSSISHVLEFAEGAKFLCRVYNVSKWPKNTFAYIFLKVATTLVDLLFIELTSHFSLVKQMYSQPIHLTHELILWMQITRGRPQPRSSSIPLLRYFLLIWTLSFSSSSSKAKPTTKSWEMLWQVNLDLINLKMSIWRWYSNFAIWQS